MAKKSIHDILAEVAAPKSPSDKAFVALHPVQKKDAPAATEVQFTGGTQKDHSKVAHSSDATGIEDEVKKEKPVAEEVVAESFETVVEQNLQEISKKVLSSYVKKAGEAKKRSLDNISFWANSRTATKKAATAAIKKEKSDHKKRSDGIATATKKLTKEDLEERYDVANMTDEELQSVIDQLNVQEELIAEISKSTLKSYVSAARDDRDSGRELAGEHRAKAATKTGESARAHNAVAANHDAVANKRHAGIQKALSKLKSK